ncbi:MAG: helix-turn-helix domain-containing protein [Marivivens sp.]|nr:helix-turn-helix domain-containing protein [Marivivens sp.]NCW68735.1 helix-turn-helix domain-containing protein [Marivivens sp.]
MPGKLPSEIDGLRERERLAVDLLARGKTCREVARTLNISERTLYSWRKRPAVQRAIYALQQELLDAGGGQGITVVPMAVATLTEIMNDPEAKAADRIAASRTLLTGAQAFQERKLLERTISDLEHQLYGLMNETPPPELDQIDPDINLLPRANDEN